MSLTGGRGRAWKPAAGSAAHAFGGSEDGRASLYGDGLVRLWLDGSAADGEYPFGSHLETFIVRRLQRARGDSSPHHPAAEKDRQEVVLPEVRKEIAGKSLEEISQEGRQEGGQKGCSEECPEIDAEHRTENGQEEHPEGRP